MTFVPLYKYNYTLILCEADLTPYSEVTQFRYHEMKIPTPTESNLFIYLTFYIDSVPLLRGRYNFLQHWYR